MEILIVVIILGILAAIALPAFSNASTEAKEAMLMEDLRIMRTQISSYMIQHNDAPPGYPAGGGAPSEADFADQMTMYTDVDGNTNAAKTAVFCYGPYMREVPKNSVSNLTAISIVADGAAMPAAPPADTGWVYKPETLTWRAGNQDNDSTGKPYYEY